MLRSTGSNSMEVGSRAGMEIYQLTKNGLALEATVQKAEYWRDNKPNR